MYVVANRVYVKPEWSKEFETRFRDRAGEIDKQPGFLQLHVIKPVDGDSPYVVLTTWQDEAAFDTWVGSEDFRASHQHPMRKEASSEPGAMERHHVVIAAQSVSRD